MFKTALYRDYYLYAKRSVIWVSSLHLGEIRFKELKAESLRDIMKMQMPTQWAQGGAGASVCLVSSRRCHVAGHQTTLLNKQRWSSLGSLASHAQQTAVLIGNFQFPFLHLPRVHPEVHLVQPFWCQSLLPGEGLSQDPPASHLASEQSGQAAAVFSRARTRTSLEQESKALRGLLGPTHQDIGFFWFCVCFSINTPKY